MKRAHSKIRTQTLGKNKSTKRANYDEFNVYNANNES